MEAAKRQKDLAIIFLLSAGLFIWNNWSGSLTSWDAAFYAQVSREVIKSGNWVDLTWSGSPWADKPPLYFWATAVFYRIFGVNEFSARLFSSLCGIGTVIVTYLLALKLYSRKTAIGAALVLLSTWHFIWAAKVGMLDSAFTFFIILSLFLFRMGEEKAKYLFFCGLAFGFAFMTKGTGALIIPGIIFIYVLAVGKFKILKTPALWQGILVSLPILIWWHGLAIAHYGKFFVDNYFLKHLLRRTGGAIEGHEGGFFTYFGVIPNKGRPWGAIGLIALLIALIRVFWKKDKSNLLLLVWVFCVLLIFSAAKTKLHWYIMPVYPALAILIGWGMEKVFKKYTISAAIVLFAVFITYLSIDRKIFKLDYSPQGKELANLVNNAIGPKEIILYGVGDPGVQFYLGQNSRNINQPEELLAKRGEFAVLTQEHLVELPQEKIQPISRTKDFVLIRIK